MLPYIQWCIAKNGGGYTQRGVAKGLKITAYLWSLRWVYAVKKTRGLVYGVYPRIPPPQYTTAYIVGHWCCHIATAAQFTVVVVCVDVCTRGAVFRTWANALLAIKGSVVNRPWKVCCFANWWNTCDAKLAISRWSHNRCSWKCNHRIG